MEEKKRKRKGNLDLFLSLFSFCMWPSATSSSSSSSSSPFSSCCCPGSWSFIPFHFRVGQFGLGKRVGGREGLQGGGEKLHCVCSGSSWKEGGGGSQKTTGGEGREGGGERGTTSAALIRLLALFPLLPLFSLLFFSQEFSVPTERERRVREER